MIHTGTFLRKFDKNNTTIYTQVNNFMQHREGDSAFSVKLTANKFFQYLYIRVDFIKLLKKSDITEIDYAESVALINTFTKKTFNLSFDELKLNRIDFRLDKKFRSRTDLEVTLDLLQRKLLDKVQRRRKKNLSESSIYYNSKSCKILIYDKEKEREETGHEATNDETLVLRLEFQVLSPHINYMLKKHGIKANLKSYFSNSVFTKYMKNVLKTINSGDFVKLSLARKIINESSLSAKQKSRIEEFLIDVSRSSLNTIQNKTDERGIKYKATEIKKIKNQLESLGINPILIPKNSDCSNLISNPFSELF